MMFETIFALLISLALTQSGINSEKIREANNTTEVESKVVQTVKVEKEKVVVKVKPKAMIKEVKKEEDVWYTYTATAFTNHYASTGKNKGDEGYGITATGLPTEQGVTIAADWSILPPNTIVYIKDIGTRVVTDRGGAINGKHIDVYFESERDALNFGRKEVKLKIIEMGDKD